MDGFESFGSGSFCPVLVAPSVTEFLVKENKSDRRHVAKIGQILEKLSVYGPLHLNNTEQFKHEGKFPTGNVRGGDVSVYVVKAFQLRVYGGLVRRNGKSMFVCIEAAKKKKNRADQQQLKRVARIIGELQ
ncbi:hypothetical protein AB1A64_09220 [Ruegeria sp. ANG10]|uniref:hypothetical protein n=1 Tax=Ruegeria sp. ANG10 TaxID=3042467 RepID=UPI003452D602